MEGSSPAECLIRVPWTRALQGRSIEDKVALNPWLISICVDEELQSSLARLSNHGTPLVSRNTPSSDPPSSCLSTADSEETEGMGCV